VACAAITMTLPGSAQESEWSLAVERVGAISLVTVSPEDSDDKVNLTWMALGGPVHNPAGAPRIGADFILENGLTLGGALGAARGSAEVDGDKLGGASFFLIEPRIGYRFSVNEMLDITPRLGATLLWGGFAEGEQEACRYDYATNEYDCNTVDGDELSGNATMLTLEGVGALRVTDSFNILVGISYDRLLSASGSVEEHEFDGGSDKESDDYKGAASSLQLWLGLGGYL
jgi:hypothetical protein